MFCEIKIILISVLLGCLLIIIKFEPSVSFILSSPCIGKDFGHGSVACICNSTYCDTLEPFGQLPPKTYYHYISSKIGKRFLKSSGNILNSSSVIKVDLELKINRCREFQQILGFGGAFTDAAGINIASMSSSLQNTIIKLYFGIDGLEYNLGRVPIAGSDFSTHPYSYDDIDYDENLSNFSLAPEDYKYKIPYIQQALRLNSNLKLFASPWSAPKWMKTNNDFKGRGYLKKKYYQTWVNYLIKFMDEYWKNNLTFWGMTTQNEPFDGRIPRFAFNSMGWTAKGQRDWIKRNLGPTLATSKYSKIKLIIMDDQRPFILNWMDTILGDLESAKYVSGVGLHWYIDKLTPVGILDIAHKRYPNYFLLGTEACSGSNLLIIGNHVALGSWDRAVDYAYDIINDLNHFVSGWTDWNLVLDLKGGPNWANNFVDSPIIVDSRQDILYKQPMYYALGHFSKFIPEESIRVENKIYKKSRGVDLLTIKRPDGLISVIILNRDRRSRKVRIIDSDAGFLEFKIDALSLNTIVYT